MYPQHIEYMTKPVANFKPAASLSADLMPLNVPMWGLYARYDELCL